MLLFTSKHSTVYVSIYIDKTVGRTHKIELVKIVEYCSFAYVYCMYGCVRSVHAFVLLFCSGSSVLHSTPILSLQLLLSSDSSNRMHAYACANPMYRLISYTKYGYVWVKSLILFSPIKKKKLLRNNIYTILF